MQCHMQARANDMHTLATSSFNAKMRELGGGSPYNPGMHRGLLVEMRKMHRRGVVDSLECARSAPAKAEGLQLAQADHVGHGLPPLCSERIHFETALELVVNRIVHEEVEHPSDCD